VRALALSSKLKNSKTQNSKLKTQNSKLKTLIYVSYFITVNKKKVKDFKLKYGSKDHYRAIRPYPPTPETCHHNPPANMGYDDAFRRQRYGAHKTVQEFLSSDNAT
jgi:hypothetical protein